MTEKADLPVIVKLALAILASLILFGGLALIALVGYQVVYADRIFPGVTVAGIDLSGLKEDELIKPWLTIYPIPTKDKYN